MPKNTIDPAGRSYICAGRCARGNICGKEFACEWSLKKHELVHKRLLHICCYFDRSFVFRSELTRHIITHGELKEYKCDYCSKTFRYKRILIRHRLLHSVERPYKCELCLRSFKLQEYLKVHMSTHTDTTYTCSYCSHKFSFLGNLKRHINTQHRDKKKYTRDL